MLGTYGWMPMQLPHTLRLNNHIRARNRLGHRENCTINLPPLAATTWCGLGSMLERTIHVARITGKFTFPTDNGGLVGRSAGGGVEDVGVGRGDGREDRFGKTEGFGEDGFGGFGEPVVEVESCSTSH